MSSESRLLIHQIGDVTVVNFQDASILDTLLIQRIAEELYSLVDLKARRKIVLDFGTVKFLASQTIGVMLNLQKKSKSIKGKVVICSMKSEIHKVFKITGLDKIFEFYPDEEKAILSIA